MTPLIGAGPEAAPGCEAPAGVVVAARRRRAALLTLAALPMFALAIWNVHMPAGWTGLVFAQWHSLLELASILVCGAIAAVAWNGRELEVPRSVAVLGSACAGALVLDLMHTLAFPGMPDLLGTNSASRSIVLFMSSRLLIALAMLYVAAQPWQVGREPRWVRRAPAAVAVYVGLVALWAFGWPQSLPTMLVEGQSLTFTKHAGEAVLVALFLLSALLFARRLDTPQPVDAATLLGAALLMVFGEVTLTLYTRLTDLALTAGHLYKVAGFWMIYRTIVADSIRAPYQRLLDSRQQLHRSEDELRTITDNIPAMVSFVDADQRYRFVNRNYQRWLGMDPARMIGCTLKEVYGEEEYGALQPHIERALAGQTFAVDHRVGSADHLRGRWLNIIYMPKVAADGSVSGVYVLSSDITDVMVAERRALFLAEHDELTTLPNRAAFQVAVGKALEHGLRDMTPFAVVFVDVDRFKVINDTLGHAVGDHLLQELAGRMRQVVRGQDLVARMGGDEMCVLLHDVRDGAHASEIAERILVALRAPVELQSGVQHHVTVSAGIAVFPQDGTDTATLLRHADIAMYRAKAAGRDGWALFGAHDGGPAEARLNLELELRTAIAEGQLVLHFQPRVNVVTGRPVGMEALVRWEHPQRGLLAPGHFIDIAEETGLIVPMGAWVLRHAGQALARLQRAGVLGMTMSVNVSARQFKNPRLVDEVAEMIGLAGCAPHQIELELTESAVMDQPDAAEATMRRLKLLGVRLAMDDFGTGYSSLGALKRFPVDVVKIDRSFVNDIPHDSGDAALTRAIIAMGHSLGLHVVAEGVERLDQLDFLRREGCDEYQGYHFAKPMPEQALTALLTKTARLALVAAS
ncbi:MAG TPA: EAL domain-containing protein [Burkholderiaceae bacterium]|nr:EAL domain-containing protein [Burkholderiaceae bacterium]